VIAQGASTIAANRSQGILLIGHGTRDRVGTEQFFQLASRLSDLVSSIPVEAAFLEFQQPTIPAAWQSLLSRGVEHIHIAPLLLFAAGHAKEDIPNIISQCCSATPGVSFDQSLPLSRHPAIIDLVAERIKKLGAAPPVTALPARSSRPSRREGDVRGARRESIAEPLGKQAQKVARPLNRTAVVMVGRGNDDPCAQTDMRLLSKVVGHRLDVTETFTAFYAMAEPRFPDVLNRLASCGRFDSIIVHPHLLFEGRLHQAIIDQTNQVSVDYPTMQFRMSAYLGPVAEVAKAVADRIDQSSTLWQCQS